MRGVAARAAAQAAAQQPGAPRAARHLQVLLHLKTLWVPTPLCTDDALYSAWQMMGAARHLQVLLHPKPCGCPPRSAPMMHFIQRGKCHGGMQ